ncbi:hypothetical protein [Microbacterium rhizophilus]|uniref:hypothetical protein n=1 Tax=Microbacterium rhizophilus TaxID=3138934 RepID=UPI0031F0D31F
MTAEQPSPRRRRILITLIAAGVVTTTLAAIGVYGLIVGPRTSAPSPTAPPSATSAPSPTGSRTPGEPETLPGLPRTSDPVRYARLVADALFTWDTLAGHSRDEYLGVLLAEADPTGYEASGLAADLRRYLPTAEVWQQLREYGTAQHLADVTAAVPESWPGILADAGDDLLPGTIAVTVDATRVRDGVWLDQPAHSEHPVAFTLFIACEPAFDRCRLLRLSALDNPLR